MTKMTRLLALMTALLLCMLPALAETAASPDDVLATINGTPITRAEHESFLAQLEEQYGPNGYGYDVTDPSIASALKQMALEYALQYAVLDMIVAENGLTLSAEEAADTTQMAREDWQYQIDQIVDQYGAYGMADISTDEKRAAVMVEVLSELESMGVTEASYIEELLTYAAYDKAYAWIVRDVTVTEEEVRAHFDSLVEADRVAYENDAAAYESVLSMNEMALMYGMTDYYTELYYKPSGYRAMTHILLAADETLLSAYTAAKESGVEADIEAAQAAVIAYVQPLVDEINEKLAAGATFAELIPLYTTDPGMMDEASIAAGYEVHASSTRWVTEFRDAAFTVDQVGDITAPVVTDYGVHILCYAADLPGGPMEYTADMQALMTEQLLLPLQSNAFGAEMEARIGAAEVVFSEEAQAFMTVE